MSVIKLITPALLMLFFFPFFPNQINAFFRELIISEESPRYKWDLSQTGWWLLSVPSFLPGQDDLEPVLFWCSTPLLTQWRLLYLFFLSTVSFFWEGWKAVDRIKSDTFAPKTFHWAASHMDLRQATQDYSSCRDNKFIGSWNTNKAETSTSVKPAASFISPSGVRLILKRMRV